MEENTQILGNLVKSIQAIDANKTDVFGSFNTLLEKWIYAMLATGY